MSDVRMVGQVLVVTNEEGGMSLELALTPEASTSEAVAIVNGLATATRDLVWCVTQLQRHSQSVAGAPPEAEATAQEESG